MRILIVMLFICLFVTSISAFAQDTAPMFEETACPFDIPNRQTVDCGYLTVPEDRSNPDSPMIRLAIGIFRSNSDKPADDPIVYLEGGPGGHALKVMEFIFNPAYAPFVKNRDLIVIDQRGTGFSEPALDCPEVTDLILNVLLGTDIETEEGLILYNEALLACHDRLESEGVNFAAYNSIESAADLHDLRLALGYKEWNVYGISYGTRLAQTYMRDFPEDIRSVILDSAAPLEADPGVETPAHVRHSFDKLFESCAADTACNEAYPDLETVFFDTVDRLNETPDSIQVTEALSGRTYNVRVNGVFLEGFLFETLYSSRVIPLLPQIIYEVADGDFTTVSLIYGSQLTNLEFVSVGMHLAVNCNEEIHFSSRGDVVAAAEEYPELTELFKASVLGENAFDICEFWGAGSADPIENEPVISDIPTLIIAGEYDPITPPVWAAIIHENLSNSYFYTFPGTGHGASVSSFECPLNITLEFVNDPSVAPDGSCISAMDNPVFEVPEEITSVTMEPFTKADVGLSSLAPVGWTEIEPGTHARRNSALDQTVLIQDALPISVDALFVLLSLQFGVDAEQESIRTEEVGNYVWDFYMMEVQGFLIDVATSGGEAQVYFILMISEQDERDFLVEQVLMPALEGFMVNP